ncbi:MAG: M48 family metalloprotease [Holosporaceae bacterium]|jgi:predicted Zn-dependent protease|nr:M48 family metalloprotease [Holosporaceae bacterium]
MRLLRALFIAVFMATAGCTEADLRIIRDGEIEEILTEIAKKIFQIAGLRPESAKIYVVASEDINAFTVGNGYVFINSGLLLRFENPLHFMAILCHETGHLAAGHVGRHMNIAKQRDRNLLLAALAGLAGNLMFGAGESVALMLGYAMTDQRFYLRFSRTEELAADALAATYLEKLGYGSEVLAEVFGEFRNIGMLNGDSDLPSYLSTHPKADDRISALRGRMKPGKDKIDPELFKKYGRILLKLRAHLKKPDLESRIPDDDYSRAVYLHGIGKSEEAADLLKKLSKADPKNIYLKETLAQILSESGHLDESVGVYEEFYRKDLSVPTKIDYANVLIEANQKIELAISILESARCSEYFNNDICRLLAKGYGKQKKEGMSLLMLAREQILLGNYRNARRLLTACLTKLNKKTESSAIKEAEYLKELLERDYGKYL